MIVTFEEIPLNAVFSSKTNPNHLYRKTGKLIYDAIYRCDSSRIFKKINPPIRLSVYNSDNKYFEVINEHTIDRNRVIIKVK